MSITELRKRAGMTQKQFAEYFEIPVRSLQEWEQDRRQPPPYLEKLLLRILDREIFGNPEDQNNRKTSENLIRKNKDQK